MIQFTFFIRSRNSYTGNNRYNESHQTDKRTFGAKAKMQAMMKTPEVNILISVMLGLLNDYYGVS